MAKLTPKQKAQRQNAKVMKDLDRLAAKGKKNTQITAAQGRGAKRRLENQIKKIDNTPKGLFRLIFQK